MRHLRLAARLVTIMGKYLYCCAKCTKMPHFLSFYKNVHYIVYVVLYHFVVFLICFMTCHWSFIHCICFLYY